MDYQAPVAQSVERVAVKPPAGWWTKSVAYARVRVPSGAVLGPGRKIMDIFNLAWFNNDCFIYLYH